MTSSLAYLVDVNVLIAWKIVLIQELKFKLTKFGLLLVLR